MVVIMTMIDDVVKKFAQQGPFTDPVMLLDDVCFVVGHDEDR